MRGVCHSLELNCDPFQLLSSNTFTVACWHDTLGGKLNRRVVSTLGAVHCTCSFPVPLYRVERKVPSTVQRVERTIVRTAHTDFTVGEVAGQPSAISFEDKCYDIVNLPLRARVITRLKLRNRRHGPAACW
jgi:hypothetical protein